MYLLVFKPQTLKTKRTVFIKIIQTNYKGNSSLVPGRDQKYTAPGSTGENLNLWSSVPRGFQTRV